MKPKLGQWGDAKEKAGEEAGTPTYSDKCRERKDSLYIYVSPSDDDKTRNILRRL